MDAITLLQKLVGTPESIRLEYKATLIPSLTLAQILAGFANSEGGSLIFGVRQLPRNKYITEGLSGDFKVHGIVQKAVALLSPLPKLSYSYFSHEGKQLFGINIEKSHSDVLVEGQKFARSFSRTVNLSLKEPEKKQEKFPRFTEIKDLLLIQNEVATSSKKRLINHYLNILKLYEPTLNALFPSVITDLTTVPEGKIFNRILYSSCVDNFETYLSELLYEIYLAKPETLKAGESTVRVADVLNCADMEEFVQWFAGRRVSKLQKGSIEGFLLKNPEIASLQAIAKDQITELEKILQIRHLYAHRNGIVDESFLVHFKGQYKIASEHQLSISQVLDTLQYIIGVVSSIDRIAADKYLLSTQVP